MTKPRATPTCWDKADKAVANVLCPGGNHSVLSRGGAIMITSPTTAMRMWPMWNRTTHCLPSGTKIRMVHPTARIQALVRTDTLSPKRCRNHMKGKVNGMKTIGPYAVERKKQHRIIITVEREIFARKNIRRLRCFIFIALAYRKCSFVLIIRC